MTAGVEMGTRIERQALRLALAAELTHRTGRIAGGAIAAGADLAALAGELGAVAGPVARAHRLRFDPAYPGVASGVEDLRGTRRLVLACTARDEAGDPAAVVFTTLIAGRAPQVSAAPPEAAIPPGWA
jgi:acyl-coenzyme A thioesterase PaaI-like protein